MAHAKETAASIIANQPLNPPIATVDASEPPVQSYNLGFDITDQIYEIYKQTDYLPWTSFDLTNIGPNPVYFCVNEWLSPEAPLPVGQSINIDFKKHGAIKKVYLKCDSGQRARVLFYIIR